MEVQMVPTAQIRAGNNDRRHFAAGPLQKLAASIERHGLQTPIEVRPMPADAAAAAGARFQIIAGERRFRACTDVLGWSEIPAHVVHVDDASASARMLMENMLREDLTAIEEARAYRERLDAGMHIEDVCLAAGVKRGHVLDMLPLLDLRPDIAAHVGRGHMPIRHAQILAAAGLNAHNQLAAFETYGANPAPTAEWFAKLCADTVARQDQQELFAFGDDLVLAVQVEARRQVETPKPRPGVDAPPMRAADLYTRCADARAYWTDAADRWAAEGHERTAAQCSTLADALALALDGVAIPPERAPRPCTDCRTDIAKLHGNRDRCPRCYESHRMTAERERHERRSAAPALTLI